MKRSFQKRRSLYRKWQSMREKILSCLKQSSGYLSGEELSEKLGFSRQGLWKHIHELKELGYEISAVPHLGYKLDKCPDRLYPCEVRYGLKAKSIGREVVYYDKLSSTTDEAWQLGCDNASEGTVVCAESQSKGRGRMGRIWVSPKYKGIYFSVIFRPGVPLTEIPCITLLTAVALVRRLKRLANLDISIKWPNDILSGGRKLAGILTELNAEQDRVNFVIAGMGLNVNNTEKELPKEAVSLRTLLGRKLDRVSLFKEILSELDDVYREFKRNGPKKILSEWRTFSYTWGKRIKVSTPNRVIEGVALDLDTDGALLIRLDSGVVEKTVAGDVNIIGN